MTNRTDTSHAVELLERSDPLEDERLTAELDLAAARARVSRMIAADASRTATRPARSQPPRSVHRRRLTGLRIKATIASVAGAAAVAVIAVVLVSSGTPEVQSASAKTITRVLHALTPPAGSMLHIDSTSTEVSTGHPTYIWRQEVYEQLAFPYRSRVIDKRLPGTPAGTEGITSAGAGEPTYDPINNVIYDPTLPKPKPTPGMQTPTRAQLAQLFEPYMAQYVRHLRAKLASGAARVDGRATVNGRSAIVISFVGSDEVDYVAAGSYFPIKTVTGTPSSPGGGRTITVYHTFEFLPMKGNARLLSLTAQHPSARVDRSLADFRAAGKRLFRDG